MTDIKLFRLQQLQNAVKQLERALEFNPDEISITIDAAIQRFEFCYELSCKYLKALLLEKGVDVASPRDVLNQSFVNGLIEDQTIWLDMIKKRNITSHTYHQEEAEKVFKAIPSYLKEFRAILRIDSDNN